MKVICFTSQSELQEKLSAEVLCHLPADDHLEQYEMFEDFLNRMYQPKDFQTIVILCVNSISELKEICSISDFLLDCKIILVLPDRNHTTLDLAYKLYPRYFISIDQDLNELVEILNQMRKKSIFN